MHFSIWVWVFFSLRLLPANKWIYLSFFLFALKLKHVFARLSRTKVVFKLFNDGESRHRRARRKLRSALVTTCLRQLRCCCCYWYRHLLLSESGRTEERKRKREEETESECARVVNSCWAIAIVVVVAFAKFLSTLWMVEGSSKGVTCGHATGMGVRTVNRSTKRAMSKPWLSGKFIHATFCVLRIRRVRNLW